MLAALRVQERKKVHTHMYVCVYREKDNDKYDTGYQKSAAKPMKSYLQGAKVIREVYSLGCRVI